MDVETARWLVSPAAQPYLAHVHQVADPSSLRVATELRRRLSGDQAAALLALESLRRQGRTKLGARSAQLYLTRDGLEQATRWPVARWRAARLAAAGVTRLVDAGCGLGIDALASASAGLEIVGIERDEVTAIFARANLATATILHQTIEATDFGGWLSDPATALFLDPARRTERGRSWQLADLSPAWPTVLDLVATAAGPTVVKLAPGFPYGYLPDTADVSWVSQGGDLVETSLWLGPGAAGARSAVVLGSADPPEPVTLGATNSAVPIGPIERYLYEPDPAVIRARAVGDLAKRLGAHGLADRIAYLSGPSLTATPLAQAFVVKQTFPYSEKALRAWAHANDVGAIEIKLRGLQIDPAQLRRDLRLSGQNHTLVILTPTPQGTLAVVAERAAA